MSRGRPTKYKEEFCETVKSIGDIGGSVYEMADACDVALSSLYEWAKEFPIFSEAFTRAREKSKAYVGKFHRINALNPDYNPRSTEITCKFIVQWKEYANTTIPELKTAETYTEQMKAIINAVATGVITMDEGDKLANIVSKAAKVEEVDELRKVLVQIEEERKQQLMLGHNNEEEFSDD